jgi:hypothetical protein
MSNLNFVSPNVFLGAAVSDCGDDFIVEGEDPRGSQGVSFLEHEIL